MELQKNENILDKSIKSIVTNVSYMEDDLSLIRPKLKVGIWAYIKHFLFGTLINSEREVTS